MATLSQLPPSLQVTAATEDMEISSEIGRFDNNDVDLDLTGDHVSDQDEDLMLEDAKSETGMAPSIHDQDMNQESFMYDERENIQDTGAMEDDAIFFDEHLTDASIEEPVDTSIQDFNEEPSQSQPFDDDFAFADVGEAQVEEQPQLTISGPMIPSAEHIPQPPLNAQAANEDRVHVRDFDGKGIPRNDGGPEVLHQNELDPNVSASQMNDSTVHDDSTPTVAKGEDSNAASEAQATLNQDPARHHADADDTATDSQEETNLLESQNRDHGDLEYAASQPQPNPATTYHSITVNYQDSDISLFPPRTQLGSQMYFLQDSSLASRSIGDLLQACRGVLGTTITEEQELQLEIHDLDLTIGEESAHALSTSFSELLEVYLSLYRLDGFHEPDPLYVKLTTKTKFSAQLSLLRGAVAEGRGMSKVWPDDAEEEEYLDEQTDLTSEVQKKGEDGQEPNKGASVGDDGYAAVGVSAHGTRTAQDLDFAVGEDNDAENLQFHDEEQGIPLEAQDELISQGNETEEEHFDSVVPLIASVDGGHENIQDSGAQLSVNPDEEALIDYGDQNEQDENNSSGSSTIVGDGSGAQDEGKVQGHPASAQALTSTIEAESSIKNQENVHQDKEHVEHTDGDQEQEFAVQDHFSAEFDEETYDFDAGDGFDEEEGEINPNPRVSIHAEAGDQNDHDTGIEPDEVDWEEDVADSSSSDHIATVDASEHAADDEEEEWNDFLESEQPLGQEEKEDAPHTAGERTLRVQSDFAASTETLVAATDDPQGQPQQSFVIGNDDFDEITFDEEDEVDSEHVSGANDPPNSSRRPSESPPGKRSFAEHLEGDPPDEAESETKRLRST